MTDMVVFMQLLRKMAHDLRVPLNTVISTGDMLAGGMYDSLTVKQTKAVTRLQRNNHRILAILDDFMAYMKAYSGELDLICKPFDPRKLLQECVDQVQAVAEEKGVILSLTTSEIVPVSLVGDEKALSRIALALLWNAVSYTSQGEIQIISEWTAQQEWLISVHDNGAGISDGDRPYIFDPFWRGEDRPQVPTAGAGLGLPLSLALTRLMQGDLILKETSTRGSTFCVRLPLEQAN
jgi:signal transduction histidine kinase